MKKSLLSAVTATVAVVGALTAHAQPTDAGLVDALERRPCNRRSPPSELLVSVTRAGETAGRRRPARTHRRLDGRRCELAAGAGAGQLRPDRGLFRQRQDRLGRRPRRCRARFRRWRHDVDPAARRSHRQRSGLERRPGQARRRSRSRPSCRHCWPRPSATRRRARTSRSSTSGSRTRRTASWSGAYNLLLETSDGGQTWQSWFDRADNPRFMNLYAIRPAAGGLYIAGEGGTVLKLDPVARRFVIGVR